MHELLKNKSYKTADIINEYHAAFNIPLVDFRTAEDSKSLLIKEFITHVRGLIPFLRAEACSISSEVESKLKNAVETSTTRKDLIIELSAVINEKLVPTMEDFFAAMSSQLRNDESVSEKTFDFMTRFMERFHTIREPNVWEESVEPEMRPYQVFADVIKGGIENVTHRSFSLLEVTASIFENTHRRLPSPGEWSQLASTTLGVLLNLVSVHDDLFDTLDNLLTRSEAEDMFKWLPYQKQDFQILDGKVELHPEILNFVIPAFERNRQIFEYNIHEPRVGCGGTALIPHIFNACLRAAEHSLFLNAEKVVSLL